MKEAKYREFFFNERDIYDYGVEEEYEYRFSTICENDWCSNITIDNVMGFISTLLYLDHSRDSLKKRINLFYDQDFLESDEFEISDEESFSHFSKKLGIGRRRRPETLANYYNYIVLNDKFEYNGQDIIKFYKIFLDESNNLSNKSILIKQTNNKKLESLLSHIKKNTSEATSLIDFKDHLSMSSPGFIYSTNSKKHPTEIITKFIGKDGKLDLANLHERIIFDKKNKPYLL